MRTIDKRLTRAAMAETAEKLRRSGQRIVFTNGCFDILHAGHVRYLNAARAQGDVLVVGLNSDVSVQSIKGPRRPIVGQDQRAEVLSGLMWVDFVVLFDEDDPLQLICAVKPDILVKGADWAAADIVGAAQVASWGGRLVRIPLVPGISTSIIIDKILGTYGPAPAAGSPP